MRDITINMNSMLDETAARGGVPVEFHILQQDWDFLVERYGDVIETDPKTYRGIPVEVKPMDHPRILEYLDTRGEKVVDDLS